MSRYRDLVAFRLSEENQSYLLSTSLPQGSVHKKNVTHGFGPKINRIVEDKQNQERMIAALERFLDEPVSYEDLQEDEL